MDGDKNRRFLGITVLSDFVLNEGVEEILDNLINRTGASAVTVNPTVTAPAPEGTGSFQPPIDAGSSPRVFDRPLWSKRSLWVRSAPSFHPTESYYADTPYRPRRVGDLTDEHGDIVGRFIHAARDRGLKVYLQLSATSPPELRQDDIPRLPDGRIPHDRLADTGSLASPAIRAYNDAYVHDLLDHYPEITGLRPDWPEYPCYKIDEAFQDFGPHVEAWAGQNGFDFERIREAATAAYRTVHGGLTDRSVSDLSGAGRGVFTLLNLMRGCPEYLEWLRLKSALSIDLLSDWRRALTRYGGSEKELSANAFMTPFTLLTGFDFAAAAGVCTAVSPKLYTMHWSMMVKFWCDVLLAHNPELTEKQAVRTVAGLFDIAEEATPESISAYGYPKPDEPHPIPIHVQARKVEQVMAAAREPLQVMPLVHGYGPFEDFCRRLRVVADSPAHGVWINRYGYLSDEKLDAIGRIWH